MTAPGRTAAPKGREPPSRFSPGMERSRRRQYTAFPTRRPLRTAMPELTRVSISLEDALLKAFDAYLTKRGYENRSEALRDLIRDRLVQEQAQHAEGEQV